MLYAKTSKVVPQVLADLGLLAVIAIMVFVSRKVRDLINLFAVPAQTTADAATSLSTTITTAGQDVASVPLVGEQLQKPFDAVATGVTGLVSSIQSLVTLINTTALVLAIIVFVVPIVVYLWKWIPWRFAFVREASAGKKLIPAPSSPELFALRAIANAPMHELAQISPDPMGAWKSGNQVVIAQLANLELNRDGLKLPKKRTGLMVTDQRTHQSER